MQYKLTLTLKDRGGKSLMTSQTTLDTDEDMEGHIGISIADTEHWLIASVRDIDVKITEEPWSA